MTQINTSYNRTVFGSAIATETLQLLMADMPEEQVREVIAKASSKVMMNILNKQREKPEAALLIDKAVAELIRGLEKVQAAVGAVRS